MSFNGKAYAESVWTPERIATLEADWLKQQDTWYKLLDPLLPNNNENVLDCGSGIGVYYPLLKRKAKQYVGLDITENMVRRARERYPEAEFHWGSVMEIPFPEQSFDLVFSWSLLFHLPLDKVAEALNELWRVTRKHLFFNMYTALGRPSLSEHGSWREWQTAIGEEELVKLIDSFKPRRIGESVYESVTMFGGGRMQRKIYVVTR